MSDDINRPDSQLDGQATASGDSDRGQSGEPKQLTQPEQAARTQAEAIEFVSAEFDSLPPEKQEELRPYYEKIRKELQGGFTKKSQHLAKMRQDLSQKEQAYDQFMQNPVANMQRMAQQYGYVLTPAQAAQLYEHQQKQAKQIGVDWSPNTWDEVFSKSSEYVAPMIEEKINQRLSAYEQKLAQMERKEAERNAALVKKQLDSIDPDWQLYEDEMRQTLERHPSLANDIPTLYRVSVPEEKLMSKATQAALKKYDQKVQAAKVESSSQSRQSEPARPKITTFEEAFQNAKKEISGR